MADDPRFPPVTPGESLVDDTPLGARPPSGGKFTGGVIDRRSRGAELNQPYKWTCPGCGTEHLHALEQGCPICLQRLEAQAVAVPTVAIDPETLKGAILKHPASVHAEGSIRAGGLTPRARRTLYRALAQYGENSPQPDQLPRAQILAWARLLAEAEALEMEPTK